MLKLRNVYLVFALFPLLLLCLSCGDDPASPEDKNEPVTVTDIDGNVYQTIKIGNQLWMAENLKVTHYRNGDAIPHVTDNGTWTGLSTGAYSAYNNDNGYISTYGLLYNWFAVVDSRNIAPTGWHVPTDADWAALENYLIVSGYNWDGTTSGNKIGKSLASKTGWDTSPDAGQVGNDLSTNNTSGFTALPGGCRFDGTGEFDWIGEECYLWSATEVDGSRALNRGLSYIDPDFHLGGNRKQLGFYVRLIRD